MLCFIIFYFYFGIGIWGHQVQNWESEFESVRKIEGWIWVLGTTLMFGINKMQIGTIVKLMFGLEGKEKEKEKGGRLPL